METVFGDGTCSRFQLSPNPLKEGVWTAPYFDAGGGELWMVTRSVPVRDAEGVFALITTDLPVEDPVQ